MSSRTLAALAVLLVASGCGRDTDPDGGDGIVDAFVLTKTLGYRHDSISDCVSLLEAHGLAEGWRVSASEHSAEVVAALDTLDVVVFCNTSGDVFGPSQEAAFEQFIRAGGGYVGIHSAADTEYEWPFYGELVGARFDNHPIPQVAVVRVETTQHPATAGLPSELSIEDEWYNYQSNPRGRATVLATLDESSYDGGEMGDDHPIMWFLEIGAGRAFYIGLGHRPETYARPEFRAAIRGAVEWGAGF